MQLKIRCIEFVLSSVYTILTVGVRYERRIYRNWKTCYSGFPRNEGV